MILIKDGVALYAGDLTLTDEQLICKGFVDRRLNTSNAQLIDVPTPDNFRGGGFTWGGNILTITPEYSIELFQKLKAELKNKLKAEYAARMNAGVMSGIEIGNILNEIQDAAIMITNSFSTNYAVVYEGNALILNGAKLATIYGYKKNCSDNAQTHFVAIQALTTIQEVQDYDLTTGWPSANL